MRISIKHPLQAFTNACNYEFIDPGLDDKTSRMAALGFKKASGVEEVEKIRKENDRKKNIIDAINYFKVQYPDKKAIICEDARKVAEKYDLQIRTVDQYIGDIPLKNLKEIENFKVKPEDVATVTIPMGFSGRTYVKTPGMFIAAPEKEFNSRLPLNRCKSFYHGDCLWQNQYEYKDEFGVTRWMIFDPIVLYPVHYVPEGMTKDHTDYYNFKPVLAYIIVSAWGPEANDELIINHHNN